MLAGIEEPIESRPKVLSRTLAPSRSPSWRSRTTQFINDMVTEVPVTRIVSKSLVGLYLTLALWLIWQLLSLSGLIPDRKSTSPAQGEEILQTYFGDFEGYSECGIRASELYILPPKDYRGFHEHGTFCHDRKQLLRGLSEGGRIGFDAPYQSRGTILCLLEQTSPC